MTEEPVSEVSNTIAFTVPVEVYAVEPGTPVHVTVSFGDGTSATSTLIVDEDGKVPDFEIGHKFPNITEKTTYVISASASVKDVVSDTSSTSITFTPGNPDVQRKTQFGIRLAAPSKGTPGEDTAMTVSAPTNMKNPPNAVVYFGDGSKLAMDPPDTGRWSTTIYHTYRDPGIYTASAVAANHSSNAQTSNDQQVIDVRHNTYTVWEYNTTATEYNNKTKVAENRPGPDWEYVKVDHTDETHVTSMKQPKSFSAPSANPPYHWELDRTYWNSQTQSWWQEWDKYETHTYVKWKKTVKKDVKGPLERSLTKPIDDEVWKDTDTEVTYSCADKTNPYWGEACSDENGNGVK